MATAEGTDDIQIKDEEEYVPKRVKKRILDSRERVNEREDELFTARVVDPEIDISEGQAVVAWGNTVKQFMRDIEVLLERLDIESASHYLHDVHLGEVSLVPPDMRGYAFSRVVDEQTDDAVLRQQLGLPRDAELPRPKGVPFNGLQSIIEREPILQEQWRVCIDASGPPPAHQYLYPEVGQPVPKWIYENAIRAADRFLQDAGIGVDVKADPHFSTEPGL